MGLSQAESGGYYPPDTQVAAGGPIGVTYIFEAVNTEGRIWNAANTSTPVNTFDLNSFFGLAPSVFLSDPKIRFDPLMDRWFVAAITVQSNTSGTWQLAVSTGSDPTGTFVLFSLPSQSNTFPDFPALGINDDKVVLTANAFSGNSFKGTEFWVLNKVNLLSCTSTPCSVASAFFPPPQGLFTIQPAHSLSSTATLFMAAVKYGTATSIRIWSVTGVPGSTLTVSTANLALTHALSIPPDAQQSGTTAPIATNFNDLLDAAYRGGYLWVSANDACVPPSDSVTRACLRFIQVNTSNLTLSQDFDFGQAGLYYYYPAIQISSANDLLAVFSRSSAVEYAAVYASGQQALCGCPNTLGAPILIKGGEASYIVDPPRWGDYSGAGIDPSGTTVWVAGEYAQFGNQWGTWIAQVHF